MKFLLVTYCDPNSAHVGPTFGEVAKITEPPKEEYCKIHGYEFYSRKSEFKTKHIIGWERIELIVDFIDKYDWIFYTDCDSMIMNQGIRLENLIDDNYDIIMSKTSPIELSTGVMLVKCSEWSKNFFTNLLTKSDYYNANMFEQGAINNEVNNNEDVKSHFKIVQLRYFNSFAHGWHTDNNFQIGDFICHAAGSSNDYRVKLFSFLEKYIVRMPEKVTFNPFINIGDNP